MQGSRNPAAGLVRASADEPDRAGLQCTGPPSVEPCHRAGLLRDWAGRQRAGPRQHLQVFSGTCRSFGDFLSDFILLGWRCRSSYEEQQFQRLSPYSSCAAGRPESNSCSGSCLSRAVPLIVLRSAAVSVALIVVEWRRHSFRKTPASAALILLSGNADRLPKSCGFNGSHLSRTAPLFISKALPVILETAASAALFLLEWPRRSSHGEQRFQLLKFFLRGATDRLEDISFSSSRPFCRVLLPGRGSLGLWFLAASQPSCNGFRGPQASPQTCFSQLPCNFASRSQCCSCSSPLLSLSATDLVALEPLCRYAFRVSRCSCSWSPLCRHAMALVVLEPLGRHTARSSRCIWSG